MFRTILAIKRLKGRRVYASKFWKVYTFDLKLFFTLTVPREFSLKMPLFFVPYTFFKLSPLNTLNLFFCKLGVSKKLVFCLLIMNLYYRIRRVRTLVILNLNPLYFIFVVISF